jgi:ribonuclease D
VDTEWGDAGDADPRAPPALVQLATDADVFLVDVTALRAAAPRALATLAAKLLLDDDGLVVVGFAFGSDAPRLEALLDAAGAKRDVVDLQRLDGRRARLPSLRDCCATWLRRRLDKSEQCSDWDRRPLSASQLAYAALDASVLLPLHDAMVAAR